MDYSLHKIQIDNIIEIALKAGEAILDIYKKLVFGSNLAIGFMWGIEGYLYGLIIAMVLAVYLNIIFASREIDLPKWQFIRPLVIQAVLTILIVLSVEFMLRDTEESLFTMLMLKGFCFAFLYMALNKILALDTYVYTANEAKSMIIKLIKKVRP